MRLMKYSLLPALLLLSVFSFSQTVTNGPAYKNLPETGYVRLCYENDYFSATDRYYTQGMDIEFVHPQFRKLITNKLFINPHFNYNRYGIGLQHNVYTPSSISHDDIIYGDRPFAGVAMLKTFVVSVDTIYKQRFTSSIHCGVIGPLAGAGEMQEMLHRGLANLMPRGWANQIHNDLALNYHIGYEKELFAFRRFFSVSAAGQVNVGTLSCGGGFGSTIMLGYFRSPYNNDKASHRDFQIYVYEYPEIYIPGYDATLQGGMFNRTSPYVILETDMTRPVRRNRLGFVISYRNVYLEYFATTLSKEFATGSNHAWGGVQLSVGF